MIVICRHLYFGEMIIKKFLLDEKITLYWNRFNRPFNHKVEGS